MAKNEAQTDIDLFNYLTNDKSFSEQWKTKRIDNTHITDVLRILDLSAMRALAGHQSVRLTGDKELRRLTAAQP